MGHLACRQTWRTATLTRRDQDKHSEWGRMAGLSQKIVAEVGLEKPMLDPLSINSIVSKQEMG